MMLSFDRMTAGDLRYGRPKSDMNIQAAGIIEHHEHQPEAWAPPKSEHHEHQPESQRASRTEVVCAHAAESSTKQTTKTSAEHGRTPVGEDLLGFLTSTAKLPALMHDIKHSSEQRSCSPLPGPLVRSTPGP